MLCGIDEAGRGPLAGPVCAASVILCDNFSLPSLDDSKKLNAKVREELKTLICERSFAWGLGWASPGEIDTINIHKAVLLAMKRAFYSMLDTAGNAADFASGELNANEIRVVVDGLFTPDISASCQAVVKADSKVPAVMAASILAKTARDRLMEHYALFYPEYGYDKHKGYPTKAHRQAIAIYGPSAIQRLSFRGGETGKEDR